MNFYVILGVAPDASTADIKRAYRRLARRHHPGINPGDRAAHDVFTRISEAYETLVDPRRRQAYDSGSPAPGPADQPSVQFAEFDFSARALGSQAATFSEIFAEILHPIPGDRGRPEAGADLHATLAITFVDMLTGTERQVVVTRQIACTSCSSRGVRPAAEGTCPSCAGSGHTRRARGHMVFKRPCTTCAGTGRRRFDICAACAGQGRTMRSEAVLVRVPAGLPDGARLRIPAHGHAGRHGGPAGDLSVTVQVQPHHFFRRDGDDLVCTVPVAVHEAVLGARIDVPLIDGGVRLRIPAGTQGGQRFRIAGRGVPTPSGYRGDLVVETRLVLPDVVDDRSRELMQEFGRLNQDDVRKDLMRQP